MEPFSLPQTFQGRTIAEAKAKAAAVLGDDFVQVGEARWEHEGGIAGFFEKRRVTIMAQRADLIAALSRLPRESDLQPTRPDPQPSFSAVLAGKLEDEEDVQVEFSADALQAARSDDSWSKVQASQTAASRTLQADDLELVPGGEYEQSLREQMERNPALLLSHEERLEVLQKHGIDLTRRPSFKTEPIIFDAPEPTSSADPFPPLLEEAPAGDPVVMATPFPELDMFEEITEPDVPEKRISTATPFEPAQPTVTERMARVEIPVSPSLKPEPAVKLPAEPVAVAPESIERAPEPEAAPSALGRLNLETPSTAAAAVEAQFAPEKLRDDLEGRGVPSRLAASLVEETMLLGGPILQRKSVLETVIARRFRPAPLAELVTAPVIIVCGERLAGKSGLVARMLAPLAANGRKISVASVGPMDNSGVETVRSAATRAGVFFAWTNNPHDAMLKTLAKNSDLLIVDLHAGDPGRTKDLEQIQQLKRALPGRVQLVCAVPADADADYLIEQVHTWPTTAILAVTRADCADKPGSLVGLAAAQKRPVAFISQETARADSSFRMFDPAAFARILVS